MCVLYNLFINPIFPLCVCILLFYIYIYIYIWNRYLYLYLCIYLYLFPGGSDGKKSACNVGGQSLIPGLGRSTRAGNGYSLQYSCLENSMDKGAWLYKVHGIAKTQRWLNDWHTHTHTHTHKHAHTCIYTHVCIHVYTNICIYICVYISLSKEFFFQVIVCKLIGCIYSISSPSQSLWLPSARISFLDLSPEAN